MPKNKAAQALAALRKPENMARPTETARQNAFKGWTPEARASRLNGLKPKKRK